MEFYILETLYYWITKANEDKLTQEQMEEFHSIIYQLSKYLITVKNTGGL